ncbi:hypothetical protein BD560DRAFT_486118 [Blakeslea trispora]|nr:hypothetical protein BD560DRAFT_486118 [Blakeslea trispora]
MKAWNYLTGLTSYVLPNNIQKRLYKFVLRRLIGQFLENELDLENFDIGLASGNMELRDLSVNKEFVNKMLADTPFMLEEGKITSITACIPWSKLLSADILLEIQGLDLTIKPIKNKPKSKDPPIDNKSIIEEHIMSSSLHFADDFLRTEIDQTEELHRSMQESYGATASEDSIDLDTEGLQVLSKVVDKMISRIKIDTVNTVLRIAHSSAVPLSSNQHQYHIELRIPRISYFDQTPGYSEKMMESSVLVNEASFMKDETIKVITITSPEVWLKSANNQKPQPISSSSSSSSSSSCSSQDTQSLDGSTPHPPDTSTDGLSQTEFFDTNQGGSLLFQSQYTANLSNRSNKPNQPYEALLLTTVNKLSHVVLRLRPLMDTISPMSVKQIELKLAHIRTMMTPHQLAFFMDFIDSISSNPPETNEDCMPSPTQPISTSTTTSTHALLDDLDTMQRNSFKPSSIIPSIQPLEQKIKVKLPLFEFFLLAENEPLLNHETTPTSNHLCLAIEQLRARLQRSPTQSTTSITDVRVANIKLNEWIAKPSFVRYRSTSQTRYNQYNPILQFDNRIKQDYSDEDHFPAYENISTEPLRYHQTLLDSPEALMIRVETRQAREAKRFVDAIQFEQDIQVEIAAFKLQLDPRTIDRMDAYIYAVMEHTNQKNVQGNQKDSSHPQPMPFSQKESIFDDLQMVQNVQKKKVRVRCAFIRLLLSVPDMSAISTREEFNDLFHTSQLSVDIKKLVGTWCSTTVVDEAGHHTQHSTNHAKSASIPSTNLSGTSTLETEGRLPRPPNKPNKINIDLSSINVFLQPSPEDKVKCWFTAKTVLDSKKSLSEGGLSPSIEITIQDKNATYPGSSVRSGYFGAGSEIPKNLFDFLEHNENFHGEQKLHIPMEDQSDSAMIFKQRTIETSLFVVNCHFPQADMDLPKHVWDTVQIIQNDLLLWQPRFLLLQQSKPDHSLSDIRSTTSYGSQSRERSTPHSEERRQTVSTHEQQHQSLFSIVAVMSHGTWDLHTLSKHTFRLQFSDFRYFAAIKHLEKNENITTLDIEELDLTDISNPQQPVSILRKTIPKKIHPKRNTSMVSLFSRLTAFPESNRIDKVTSVVACHLCWKATTQLDFIQQLIEFQKMPEDMVFIDPPTQYIKVYAHLLETSMDYSPVHSPSCAVLVLDGVQVITDILAGQPMIEIKTFVQSTELYLIDDRQELDIQSAHQQLEGKVTNARKYWTTIGLVNTLAIQNIELAVKVRLDDHLAAPQLDVALISTDITVGSSADSFQTLINLITYLQNDGDQSQCVSLSSSPKPTSVHEGQPIPLQQEKSHRRTSTTKTVYKEDMLASLDEEAFKLSPPKLSPPTLIEASDMEEYYVEEFYHTNDPSLGSSYYSTTRLPPTKPRRKQHRPKSSEDAVRLLGSGSDHEDTQAPVSFQIVEDYFGMDKKVQLSTSAVDVTKAVLSLRVTHLNLVWRLYDGYEWDYIQQEMAEKDIYQQSGFGEPNSDKRRTKRPRGGEAHVEFRLNCVSIDLDRMSEQDSTAMYLAISIKDVEIIDNIKTSKWKKFLGYMKSESQQREMDECMVHVELTSLRPVLNDPQQELRLKIKLLPIRLYVDQDPLDFLEKYFSFDRTCLKSTEAANQSIETNKQGQQDTESNPLFFQHVDIHPILLKLDYKPKHFNLGNVKDGQYLELVKLFHLDGAEVSLTHVKLTGIRGLQGLFDRLGQEWLPHLKQTSQVFNVASGIPPVRSLVNLGTGVADLVLLPIQQYKKDGRLMKGIQRGTSSFARAAAIEAIKLSSKMATGTQVILEHADGFFSTLPSSSSSSSAPVPSDHQQYHFIYTESVDLQDDELQIISKDELDASIPPPPKNYRTKSTEGLQMAYHQISRNLGSAAQTIFAVPTDVQTQDEDDYHHGSTKAVVRAVPIAVIKPMIGLTGALQSILAGLRNSIDPTMRLQSEDVRK